MKKIIYSFLFALVGILAACDPNIIPAEDYEGPADIRLSTEKLVFSIDGGTSAILVAANFDGWSYTQTGDWFTVEQSEDGNLMVYVKPNGTPETKTGSITVKGTREGEGEQEVSATVEMVQRSDNSVNLSADGTANCYIAGTNSSFKFDATVKGNGEGDGGRSTYIAKYGVEVSDIAYVDLLWEARNDGDKSLSREIIDGMPLYGDGYISFSTGRSEGNALIAAYDIAGNILWSWHIWVLDDEIDVHDHSNGQSVVARIMDRNLGAMNNEPMDVNNRGMFYQWGRKDPFPASRSQYVDGLTYNDLSGNVSNDEVGNGSGKWNFHMPSPLTMEVPGNIPFTTRNPMTFLSTTANVYQWYVLDEDLPEVSDSKLWDAEKTIFDPCPAGYKVPNGNMWGVPVGTADVLTGGPIAEYDGNGESLDYDWNAWKDCGRVWKHSGDYYPATGTLSINEAMAHANTGIYAFYWTTSKYPEDGNSVYYAARFISNWAYFQDLAVIFSAQVRCVAE